MHAPAAQNLRPGEGGGDGERNQRARLTLAGVKEGEEADLDTGGVGGEAASAIRPPTRTAQVRPSPRGITNDQHTVSGTGARQGQMR
eukprot:scaffold566_cov115-Isochrysis_galbana.AAC.1